MKPGPVLAAFYLHETIELEANPKQTLDWLTEIVEIQGWRGTYVSSRERAEVWHDAFLQRLRDNLSELNRWGRYCSFAFNSSDGTLVQGGLSLSLPIRAR